MLCLSSEDMRNQIDQMKKIFKLMLLGHGPSDRGMPDAEDGLLYVDICFPHRILLHNRGDRGRDATVLP